MEKEDEILHQMQEIKRLLEESNLQQKELLNFNEACKYLDISASHLYKLTSTKQIPHWCPQGKRLYFNRLEIDSWLQRNKILSNSEIADTAKEYLASNRKGVAHGK